MIDSYLRSPYQRWIIQPILKVPLLTKVLPNTLTLFALFSGLLIPLALFLGKPLIALMLLWVSGFFRHFGWLFGKVFKENL